MEILDALIYGCRTPQCTFPTVSSGSAYLYSAECTEFTLSGLARYSRCRSWSSVQHGTRTSGVCTGSLAVTISGCFRCASGRVYERPTCRPAGCRNWVACIRTMQWSTKKWYADFCLSRLLPALRLRTHRPLLLRRWRERRIHTPLTPRKKAPSNHGGTSPSHPDMKI